MKKFSFLLFMVFLAITFGGCSGDAPMYVYIDREADEPQVSQIELDEENDVEAFYKSFEKYSETRHYKGFAAVDNSAYIGGGFDACEGDEADQGMAVVNEPVEGGEMIPTDDSEATGEYVYLDLSKDNPPNFTLYKIDDKESRQAVQDYKDKKITFEELEKIIKDKCEVLYDMNSDKKGLYEKELNKCIEIDKAVYSKMSDTFRKKALEAQKKLKEMGE